MTADGRPAWVSHTAVGSPLILRDLTCWKADFLHPQVVHWGLCHATLIRLHTGCLGYSFTFIRWVQEGRMRLDMTWNVPACLSSRIDCSLGANAGCRVPAGFWISDASRFVAVTACLDLWECRLTTTTTTPLLPAPACLPAWVGFLGCLGAAGLLPPTVDLPGFLPGPRSHTQVPLQSRQHFCLVSGRIPVSLFYHGVFHGGGLPFHHSGCWWGSFSWSTWRLILACLTTTSPPATSPQEVTLIYVHQI